jgi:hypothetical protein
MSYIIATVSFPNNKGEEVVKRALEMEKKYPHDDNLGTRIVTMAAKGTLEGVKSISIIEVKKGKLEDCLTRVRNGFAMFNNIQGLSSQLDIYMTAEEALGALGMSPPA